MKKIITLVFLNAIFISCSYAQQAQTANQINLTSFTKETPKITNELDAQTSKELKTHPEYGVLPYNAPCKDCYEVLQKRDQKHRYFLKKGTNGKQFYAQSSYGDLSYVDGNGTLRTIDYRLQPAVQNGVFSANRQPFPVTVNIRDKYISILNAGKEIQINRNVSLYIQNTNGTLVSLGEPSWTNYTAGDDGVVIHNFYPGIDLEMRLGEGKVETFYRINKPLKLNGGSLVIRDNVQLPKGFVYDYSYSEKKDANGKYYEGALCINNERGARYFIIGNPAAIDENGSENDHTIGLSYTTGDDASYNLYVPIKWMNDPKRSYPILIDPFVTATSGDSLANITGSGYNATCFAGGCTYNLNVNVPPACTITDILYSFNYQALGTCNLNQGAWDLKYSTCRSPAAAGQWHTCTIGLPGLCILQGLSLYNDVKSCLPPPSCTPPPMPFTLTFYRCVQSGAGCGFSCINAATPWDMTVNGYTMSAPTITNSAGNGTVCAGTGVNLTANPDSGIVPYAYKWYPGGQTTQSITVTPNSTTTYTVTVSICDGLDSAQAVTTVMVSNSPASAGPDTTICGGNSVQLHATGGTSYSWQPTTGLSNPNIPNPVATDSATTTYVVTINAGICTSTDTVTITVIPSVGSQAPVISIMPDTNSYTITAGDSLDIAVTVTGGVGETVYLTASSTLLNGGFNASLSQPDSGITSKTRVLKYTSSCSDAKASPFHLTFTGSKGKGSICSGATDTTYMITINVLPPSAGLLDTIPNIFTPNGDHLNDSLSLYRTSGESTDCWSNFHIQIFNRWGELQYESTDFKFHWDGNNKSGTKVSEGVYYYIITADYLGNGVTKRGTVNVKM